MSAIPAAAEDTDRSPSQCWCCGTTDDPSRMVHLGNHPEVALCIRCAHSVSKWAWEIKDQYKTGPLVIARDRFRAVRRHVIREAGNTARCSADRSGGSANGSLNRTHSSRQIRSKAQR